MNLVLIGYRGTGKTSVARCLGSRLGWEWIDADVEIESRAGKPIKAIFDDAGERAFRDLETEVLRALAARDQMVLAAGGGAVLRQENRALLRRLGTVIWLTAPVETILVRIEQDATTATRRPNLTTQGGAAEVEALLAARAPLYRQCAQLEIDTQGRTPDLVADEILARLAPLAREAQP